MTMDGVLFEVGTEVLCVFYLNVSLLRGKDFFKFVCPGHQSLSCISREFFYTL
jgi:hypothetical protein